MDPSLDSSYVQKLQYMSLNSKKDEINYAQTNSSKAQPAVPPSYQRQKQKGAIENFATELPHDYQKSSEYAMYERDNIIASSKFATPKNIETIASQKNLEENDVYVQCAKPQVPVNCSPTHSMSNSSIHSSSPRTSISISATPVYENVEYYPKRALPQQALYAREKLLSDSVTYKKAQPQVATANRNIQSVNNAPLYENILLSDKITASVIGPQVPHVAPPPYPNSIHNPYIQAQLNNGAKAQPQTPTFYHNKKIYTPQQLDEINNSDYVCMSGNVTHTTLSTKTTPIQTTTAKNYDRSIATGIAQTPTKVFPPVEVKKPQPKVEKRPSPIPSPTPSNSSTGSGKLKMMGKNLLPYSITPPKPRGPTEAEKKIEEMTRQIEEEMEKHEEEGEYFGKKIY